MYRSQSIIEVVAALLVQTIVFDRYIVLTVLLLLYRTDIIPIIILLCLLCCIRLLFDFTFLSNVMSVSYSTFVLELYVHAVSALMRMSSSKLNARNFHK
jgi:hypothetical protein